MSVAKVLKYATTVCCPCDDIQQVKDMTALPANPARIQFQNRSDRGLKCTTCLIFKIDNNNHNTIQFRGRKKGFNVIRVLDRKSNKSRIQISFVVDVLPNLFVSRACVFALLLCKPTCITVSRTTNRPFSIHFQNAPSCIQLWLQRNIHLCLDFTKNLFKTNMSGPQRVVI